MGHSADIYSQYPETLNIAPGASIHILPMPGQISVILKYGSGGSLSITNIVDATGSSAAVAQAYLFGTTEALSLDLTGGMYLTATGATVVCYLLRGRSDLTGNP